MSPRSARRAALLALALAALVVAAPAEEPKDGGWRTFRAAWSLSGQRQFLPTGGERLASIVHLSGPMTVTSGRELGRGFLGEMIGFDDGGMLLVGRAVFTDERGDRIFCSLNAQPIATSRKATGTITGGTGRFSGLEGTFSFSWQYVVDSEGGEISGRAVNLEGRTRLTGAPGAPGEAPR